MGGRQRYVGASGRARADPRSGPSFWPVRRRHPCARGRYRVTPLLRFEKVALRRGGRLLFEGIDLEVRPGEMVQVTGPNGSGKSSLLRLAAGLLNAERGFVERSGTALADDHIALDRELPLARALQFWNRNIDSSMDALGLAALAEVPVRLLSSGQLKR